MTEEKGDEYIRASDFVVTASDVSISADVRKQLRGERRKAVLDEFAVRQQEDWSILADQVVGGEDRNRPLAGGSQK